MNPMKSARRTFLTLATLAPELAPSVLLAVLKALGVLSWPWWAVVAPSVVLLALSGGQVLARTRLRVFDARRTSSPRSAQEETEAAMVAAAEGRLLGVYRRLPDGRREQEPVYVGEVEKCLSYVRERCKTGDEAARRFVVQAL